MSQKRKVDMRNDPSVPYGPSAEYSEEGVRGNGHRRTNARVVEMSRGDRRNEKKHLSFNSEAGEFSCNREVKIVRSFRNECEAC